MAHRTDGANNVANLFSDGGAGVPGTTVEEDWLNMVQEELCGLIEACGITLVKGTNTQLLAACVAAATANKIMRRDGDGRAQVADPNASADVATKGYVDERHVVVSLAADFDTTSDAAVDTGLVVSIKAGVSYQLHVVARFQHGAAGDKLLLTPSTAIDGSTAGLCWSKEGSGAAAAVWEVALADLFTAVGAETSHIEFNGIIKGGASDATLKLQVDGASSGPLKRVYAGTYMALSRIA